MRVAVVEYGVGNLNSIYRAIKTVGHEPVVTDDPSEIEGADAVVLPGVGHFRAAVEALRSKGLDGVVLDRVGDVPLLGICLGMQLLMEDSMEAPGVEGLGIFEGTCVKLPEGVKVPHMGWNEVEFDCDLFEEFDGEMFYFVHSYRVSPENSKIVLGTTEYGEEFPSVIGDEKRRVYGTQFHPEKSGPIGLSLLRKVLEEG